MLTAAQKRRYWAYRKNMQKRGLQRHILSPEVWLETPKDQLIPKKQEAERLAKPAPKKSQKSRPKRKTGVTPKIEE